MGNNNRSALLKKPSESARLIFSAVVGVALGFFFGVLFQTFSITSLSLLPNITSTIDIAFVDNGQPFGHDIPSASKQHTNRSRTSRSHGSGDSLKIYVPTNPRGAELLAPGIVVSETDFYLRRLWGDPDEDLTTRPKYLVTFTVGFDQSKNIDAAVKKFSEDFTILLFHYDGRASEWDQFEWSKRAIHVSIKRQTKWWYAKRFLHPNVVAAYDYIFIWDEDIGVEHFDPEKYINIIKKHRLEISQPALEPMRGMMWEMTKRRSSGEVHKETLERPGWCVDPHSPPCAAFVELMAPVFSRDAWRCVWHMIQNDLVHGWGLDFALRRCVEPAHEKVGVVDSQWIVHQLIPSLGNQGERKGMKAAWQRVRERCKLEWSRFHTRLVYAERQYFAGLGKG
uniref:Lysine ketoglutarate reductase trans-splicing protein n=1 Tax=Ananas comosus var. bracteatus TaxID=296719 RepID=A0A6V7NNQ8_ANACO|nr:unnamed protein product [Ananas comosus var. bracteatus]